MLSIVHKSADSRKRVAVVMAPDKGYNYGVLDGIGEYQNTSNPWFIFFDDDYIAPTDPEWLLKQPWDGVIVQGYADSLIDACHDRKIPIVHINDIKTRPDVHSVGPDHLAIGHLAGEYYLDKGFRFFASIGMQFAKWSDLRLQGFKESVSYFGLDVEEYVFKTREDHIWTPEWYDQIQLEMQDWLKRLPKPLALYTCMDLVAIQAMQACFGSNLMIPEDIAILGSNNSYLNCKFSLLPISSVDPNSKKIGYEASRLLGKLMSIGKQEIYSYADIRVDPLRVEERSSTEIFALKDQALLKALRYIHKNATKGIGVTQVCNTCGISRSRLEKMFRKYLNRTPKVEIHRMQVDHAKSLLLNTNESLAVISEKCGFKHPEYFSVVFKRLISISPSVYRRKVMAAMSHDI